MGIDIGDAGPAPVAFRAGVSRAGGIGRVRVDQHPVLLKAPVPSLSRLAGAAADERCAGNEAARDAKEEGTPVHLAPIWSPARFTNEIVYFGLERE